MGENAGSRAASLALVPAATLAAAGFALIWLPSVFTGEGTLPSGHDALYHARRILDAVGAPGSVVQFDTTIHAPEGSWVTWPWGFDALMAAILTLLRTAGVDPLQALMLIPPAWLAINAALLVGVMRAVGLSPAAQWVGALAFAGSPLTQNLHGVGAIDHHFAEYSLVLATALAGTRAASAPMAVAPALALGALLGVANAVHNGLFLLQLPVLAAFGLLWLRGQGLGPRAAAALAAGLLGATLASVVPSDPWRAGFVRYDLLSWFHVYAASLTALALLLMARGDAGVRSLLRIGAGLAVATAPLLHEVLAGLSFMTAGLYQDLPMPEMEGPFGGGLRWTVAEYSALILLLPASLPAAAWLVARARDPRLVFFCVYALAGALLLTQQYRFHQFGSLALHVLPLALLCHAITAPRARAIGLALAGAITLLAVVASLPRLRERPVPGGSLDFVLTRALYAALAEACRERPGVVLAANDDGHYVTYLTRCPVLANNLVLGPESWVKLRQSRELLDASPAEVRAAAPWVRYVLVRRDDNVLDPGSREAVLARNSALRRALLIDAPPWPAGYRLVSEVRIEGAAPGLDVLGRVLEVAPP